MITYKDNIIPSTELIINLYQGSNLQRPINDKERIAKIYQNSNLILTAWDKDNLIGIARSITDFYYSCYLSDLAVIKPYQGYGIGKHLIELTKEKVGPQTTLILLSSNEAIDFYKKIGLEHIPSKAFMIKREY